MRAALLLAAVLVGLTDAGTSPGAKACCAKSCSVKSQSAGDESDFDLSPACRPGAAGLQGEGLDGTTFKVNVCPNCTTLCAPVGGPSGFGAIVQSMGQPPPPGSATCFHPETRSPINCTEPCAVVARWEGAQFFERTNGGHAGGLLARFRPVPASSAGPSGSVCDSSRLLQPWLSPLPPPAAATGPAHLGAITGSFRMEIITLCDVLATTPFVATVSTPNASDPCRVQVTVRSVAGCADLKVGLGWLVFCMVTYALTLTTVAGSAHQLVTEGRCGLVPLPCGITAGVWWLKSRLASCRDLVVFGLLRRFLLGEPVGLPAAEAEAAYNDRLADAETGARELLELVLWPCGVAGCAVRCLGAGRRGRRQRQSLIHIRSSDSEASRLDEMPAPASGGGDYSSLAE